MRLKQAISKISAAIEVKTIRGNALIRCETQFQRMSSCEYFDLKGTSSYASTLISVLTSLRWGIYLARALPTSSALCGDESSRNVVGLRQSFQSSTAMPASSMKFSMRMRRLKLNVLFSGKSFSTPPTRSSTSLSVSGLNTISFPMGSSSPKYFFACSSLRKMLFLSLKNL